MKLSCLSIITAVLAAPAPEPTDARDATIYSIITSNTVVPELNQRQLYHHDNNKFSLNEPTSGRPAILRLGFANNKAYYYDYTSMPVGGLLVNSTDNTVGIQKEATTDFELNNSTGTPVLNYKGSNNLFINIDTLELLAGGIPAGVNSTSVDLIAQPFI